MSRRVEPRPDLDQAFWVFHDANPFVLEYLLQRCWEWRRSGKSHVGVQLLINVVRWDVEMQTNMTDSFKINQNTSSRYARLVHFIEPELDGIMRVRACSADFFDPTRGGLVRPRSRRRRRIVRRSFKQTEG